MSVGEANQEADYEKMHQSQTAAGYPSDMYAGQGCQEIPEVDLAGLQCGSRRCGAAREAFAAMPERISPCRGLHNKCMQWGVKCVFGPAVNGYDMQNGRITAVKTTQGDIKADCVVICAGAWASQHWDWLGMAPQDRHALPRRRGGAGTPTCGPTGGCSRARST